MPDQASVQAGPEAAIQPDPTGQTPAVEAASPDPAEARTMIDTLASVGVGWLDITVLNYEGAEVRFEPGVPIHWTADEMGRLLPWAAERRCSVIVRPNSRATTLIQMI